MTLPAERFDHNDPTVPAIEVRDLFQEIRESCLVAHVGRHGGFEHVGRYAEVRAILGDHESYSSADGVFIPPSGLPMVTALEFDEPEHGIGRALLDAPLALKAVRALEPQMTKIVNQLVDEFCERDHVDLVQSLAEPFPAIVIGSMVGLDDGKAREARNVAAALFTSIGTDRFGAEVVRFTQFVSDQLDERRAAPRDDFLTQLSQGHVGEVEVDQNGIISLMITYLVGGHHSTTSAIAALIRHVLTTPGLRDEVQSDPRVLARVMAESLRLRTPLNLFARTTACPVQIGEHELAAKTRVLLNLGAANRDPREFEDPETFNPQRRQNRHIAFGVGKHLCPGQHLARAEMRICLLQLLKRLPDIRLDGEPVETGLVSGSLITHSSLPVSFSPTRR